MKNMKTKIAIHLNELASCKTNCAAGVGHVVHQNCYSVLVWNILRLNDLCLLFIVYKHCLIYYIVLSLSIYVYQSCNTMLLSIVSARLKFVCDVL